MDIAQLSRMFKRFTSILFGLTLIVFKAYATNRPCEDTILSPSTIDRALDKAGSLETSLSLTIANSTDVTMRNRAALRLARLEVLIERILNGDSDLTVDLKNGKFEAELESLGQLESNDSPPIVRFPDKINHIYIRKLAEKDILNLQPQLKEKYDEFVDEIATHPFADLPSKWALEKIKFSELELPNGKNYSVRLNQGYRILFNFNPPNEVTIARVSKTTTHHN